MTSSNPMQCLSNFLTALLANTVVGQSDQTFPTDTYTAPFGLGGTWNLYQTNRVPLTWPQAEKQAEKIVDPLVIREKRVILPPSAARGSPVGYAPRLLAKDGAKIELVFDGGPW